MIGCPWHPCDTGTLPDPALLPDLPDLPDPAQPIGAGEPQPRASLEPPSWWLRGLCGVHRPPPRPRPRPHSRGRTHKVSQEAQRLSLPLREAPVSSFLRYRFHAPRGHARVAASALHRASEAEPAGVRRGGSSGARQRRTSAARACAAAPARRGVGCTQPRAGQACVGRASGRARRQGARSLHCARLQGQHSRTWAAAAYRPVPPALLAACRGHIPWAWPAYRADLRGRRVPSCAGYAGTPQTYPALPSHPLTSPHIPSHPLTSSHIPSCPAVPSGAALLEDCWPRSPARRRSWLTLINHWG